MANEISVNLSCSISQTGQSVSGTGSYLASLGGVGFMGNEQTVGTAATALLLGSATPAVIYVKNLDPTNFVEVDGGSSMTGFPQKLFPGQSCLLLPLPTATVFLRADTAPVKVWAVLG